MNKRAIIFCVWGEKYFNDVRKCLDYGGLPDYPIFIITDSETIISSLQDRVEIIRAEFKFEGLMRKVELFKFLPKKYETFLFLDSDIRIIKDIEFGFNQAEKHGLAIVQAPHYSLEHFFGFDKIMEKENVPCEGQVQYNTGVMFFKITKKVKRLFKRWYDLAEKYCFLRNEDGNLFYHNNDQPFLSLAMEQLDFVPYNLSRNYNYREFGQIISGDVRIWHSYSPVPNDINQFELAWPPRKSTNGIVKQVEL